MQLGLKVQDQLSLDGQFYLSHMKLLALVLDLGLCTLQKGFGTQMCPLQSGQLVGQLHLLLLEGSQGLLNLSTGMGLSPSLIAGVPNPFIGHKNLLGDLYKNDKGIPLLKKKKLGRESESLTQHLNSKMC